MKYTIVDSSVKDTSHLGGHFGGTAMPLRTFDYIVEKYNIKSVVDLGCGPAGMVEYANWKGIYSLGLDGDTTLDHMPYIKFHDFIDGPMNLDQYFDLAWSTEFLEHVEAKYIPNYMPIFQKAQYVFCSAAYPGQGGHHHVNEQESEYWINKFAEYDFTFLPGDLSDIRKTSNDKLVTRTGLFFKNNKTITATPMTPFEIDYERLKNAANHFTRANGSHIAGYELWT